MKRKLTALTVIMAILLCVFAGCQSSELKEYTPEEEAEAEASQPLEDTGAASAETEQPDFAPVYATYDPDTVMLTVNGIDVTWQELFYWYYYEVSMLVSYNGGLPDWDAACIMDSTMTNEEYVKEASLETVKQYCALVSKANEAGVTLTDGDRADIDASWQSSVESYGGGDEEAFVQYLEDLFLSKELFMHINEINYYYSRMQEEMYGENAEKLEDSEVIEEADALEYLHAKHILISTKDAEDNDLSDEEKQAKKAEAEEILAELQAIEDPEEREAKMDELIPEKSADANAYVDGYTFLPGEMVESFETATKELGDYELGMAESNYGYHIILRLPLNADAIMGFSSDGSSYTLAQIISQTLFYKATTEWAEESEVVFSDEYENMDFAELFDKAAPAADQG